MKNYKVVIYGNFRAEVDIESFTLEEAKEIAKTKLYDQEITRIAYLHDSIDAKEIDG